MEDSLQEQTANPPLFEGKKWEMVTHTGAVFDLLNPERSEVRIKDIAVHLSRINRWNGALGPYNVGMHSLEVAELLKNEGHIDYVQFIGLIHDAHEAYMGDCIYPVQKALEQIAGEDYIAYLKQRLSHVIWTQIGFEHPLTDEEWNEAMALVKWADGYCLHKEWKRENPVDSGFLPGFEPDDFIERYHLLKKSIDGDQ